MSEPGFRKIIYPENGSIAEVPESALPHHYRAGWAPLDESEIEPEEVPDPEPVRATAASDTTSSEEGE